MFDYITGKLSRHSHESVTIETAGIGYRVMIAPHCQEKLPPIGSSITLRLSFVIREFSQALYGFLRESERDLFEILLNVSGVGPKLALSIVGHISSENLQKALFNKDSAALCKVPGIGKKTAERLLLELKGVALHSPSAFEIKETRAEGASLLLQDAVSALINLGYSQTIAQRAVSRTLESSQETTDLSLLITESLRNV
jgi:Holliday junction DNA helicase RuvA